MWLFELFDSSPPGSDTRIADFKIMSYVMMLWAFWEEQAWHNHGVDENIPTGDITVY